MPPRKSARAAAASAAAVIPPPLKGLMIVICGTFNNGITLASVTEKCKKLGADTHANVTNAVTHVITTEAYYKVPGAKVRQANDKPSIKIVSYAWLLDCEKHNKRVDEAAFLFAAAAAAAPVANGSAAKANGKKRAASPEDEVEDEEEEVKPPSKKRTKRSATKDDDDEDVKPASKAKGKAASKPASSSSAKSATKAAPKKTAAKGKAKKAATPSEDEDEAESEEEKEVKKEVKKSAAKGKKKKALVIPIDEYCPLVNYKVYIDDTGLPLDASLNQTNASNNNNKFYRIQLLVSSTGDYKTWTRWGRVGERGQNAILGNGTLADAIKNFEKKFKDKSTLTWAKRLDPPKPGKYTFIERSYEDSDDEDDAKDGSSGDKDEEEEEDDWEEPESQLDPELQNLMAMIFNQKFMQATMAALNYDANKLPLGKLSKNTITRGFQTLKDLAALFDDNSLAQKNYDLAYGAAVEYLSNQFYSIIPHAFGRNRPPIISTEAMLKKEVELLESLGDMKEAAAIMKAERAQKRETKHIYDRHYEALGMKEMTTLDSAGSEYKSIEQYLLGTKGATHHVNFKVESIFRIERDGEFDRFEKSKYASIPSDRRLLWHGSRATNFGGILSQGLRIAPPEAPVSGYMFGKGVYLADMASKSANYTCSYLSDNTGLLLLCEAELGDPMLKLTDASYTAGEDAKKEGKYSTWGQGETGPLKWKDASCIHPSLKGVQMPDTSVAPGPTNVDNAYLLYNEYIAYDVSQIRLRYLLRVRMN